MLVENPQQIEQQVHHILSRYREGKEWFRCSPEEAIAGIRQVCEDRVILESLKKGTTEKVETEKANLGENPEPNIETDFFIEIGKRCEDAGRYIDAYKYYTKAERTSADASVRQRAYELKRQLRMKSWERD